jgi:RNA polymerase sigma-70 factor (family 1)
MMPFPDTDDACIELLNRQDKQAIDYLMKRFYPALCLFAESLMNDRQWAEEMAEESFIKLWQQHGNFPNIQAVKAYLYKVTKNLCFKKLATLQTRRKRQSRFQLEFNPPSEATVLRKMIQSDVMSEIMRAVDTLPEQIGRVFRMGFLEGMDNKQIAAELQTSIQTVKNQKVRALQLLRLKLTDRDMLFLLMLMATQAGKN